MKVKFYKITLPQFENWWKEEQLRIGIYLMNELYGMPYHFIKRIQNNEVTYLGKPIKLI